MHSRWGPLYSRQVRRSFGVWEVARCALPPDGQGRTSLRFTPVFDCDNDQGRRRSAIFPEIQQERRRQDILTPVAV